MSIDSVSSLLAGDQTPVDDIHFDN